MCSSGCGLVVYGEGVFPLWDVFLYVVGGGDFGVWFEGDVVVVLWVKWEECGELGFDAVVSCGVAVEFVEGTPGEVEEI